MGSAAFAAAGYSMNSWLIVLSTALWFTVLQFLAHVVLGLPARADVSRKPQTKKTRPQGRLMQAAERDRAPPAA